ncbi:glycosyltransferase [Clostridium polynesiense]|uniref:glycosyltransferase n=1 Tax=Clostridium polynesiense TaxID=1325933 RepID=UPI0005910ACD|nr:glycosyltransferase [Clostridium polynesiense]
MKPKVLIFGSSTILGGSEIKIFEITKRLYRDDFHVETVFLYESGIIDKKIKEIPVKTQCLDIKNKGFLKTFLSIWQLIYKGNYEAIYCFGYKVNFLVRIIGVLSKVKLFTAVESTKKDLNILAAVFDKLSSFKVSKYICVSESVRKVLESRNKISRKKITVIKNGIDLNRFNICKTYKDNKINELSINIQAEDFVIGCIGNFRKAKGQDILLEAAYKLKDHPYIKFILVGDGELRIYYEKLIKDYGLKEKVILLGVREDIPELMSILDILVVPSRWEGFGLAAVEAMACKVPIIASNVDGLSEIIQDEVTGVLFEKENSSALAEKILFLKENKFKREDIAEAAYKYTTKEFDIEIMMKKIENLILYEKR